MLILLLFSFGLVPEGFATLAIGRPPSSSNAQPVISAAWRQARSPDLRGGSNYEALLQTAEFDRSDPGLAGMMVRCRDRHLESIFVLVEPLAPRTHARVAVAVNGVEESYDATPIPTGAGLSVPLDIERDLQGKWGQVPELAVRINTPALEIKGVVSLEGLSKPLAGLAIACAATGLESEQIQ